MLDPDKIREELARPFPDEVLQTVNKGGSKLTYVPVAEVIARLNLVLGVENWGDETRSWISAEHPGSVLGESQVWIDINGKRSQHSGQGGDTIKFYNENHKNAGQPLDLGDALKTAASDAFKKACQKFGIGLDIARKEDALEAEAADVQRLEKDKYPALTKEDIDNIREQIDALSQEDRKKFGAWWAEEVPYKLTSGKVTEAYLPDIVAELSKYTPA